MPKELKYPRYYNVDDVPIKVDLDGEEVFGMVANGQLYPPVKAYVEGYEITKSQYEELAKRLYGKVA